MGSWRYRCWVGSPIDRDVLEVRLARTRKNVDCDKHGNRRTTVEVEYAKFIVGQEGFDWFQTREGATIPPFITITGQQFASLPEEEAGELMMYLSNYRREDDEIAIVT